jgi:Lon protease-like protein
VLFPGSRFPLHIFELRYRTLIRECLDRGSAFGVNLIDHGHLHPVGCLATVVTLTRQYPDGRMDIVVEGGSRYRLMNVIEDTRPYVVGEVELLTDDVESTDPELIADCVLPYNQIIHLVCGPAEPSFSPEEIGNRSPAFLMAPKCGLSNEQKQQLLELTSENSRLELLRDHLKQIVPTIRRAEHVQRIIRSDGYLKAIEE